FDFLPEAEQRQGLWQLLAGAQRDTTLRLIKDDTPLTGRIEDAAGRPAAGVAVTLEAVWANEKNDLSAWLEAVGRDPRFAATHMLLPVAIQGKGLRRFAATTDDGGRFRLAGIGSGRLAYLQITGPGVAAATVLARTQAGPRLDIANLDSFLW